MRHDLAGRLEHAKGMGLVLRERTSAHIRAIARGREYLAARYGPDCLSTALQMNRLLATLEEVARKVPRAVAEASMQPLRRDKATPATGKVGSDLEEATGDA